MMIGENHIKTLSKSKPTDVWCLDPLGEHSIRFDRLSLCSQIKAIPIEDVVAMLSELKYDLYPELCKEIHGKEDCPCVGQTTSCLATFRVCDANRAIDKGIQEKINSLKEDKNEIQC